MKIEIWSDFVCPFCYIGKRSLELALEQFDFSEQVKVEFKSYELDPNREAMPNQNIHEYLATSKGISFEYAKRLNENVAEHARSVGLTFNFDTMQHTNTFDAHRIAQYAGIYNVGKELTEKLMHAYFTDSELISDRDTLIRLAKEVGLDKNEVENILFTNRFAKRVNEDEELARELGVTSVPFFVFNEKHAISGAQPVETFQKVLDSIWEEESQKHILKSINHEGSKTSYCTGKECEAEEE